MSENLNRDFSEYETMETEELEEILRLDAEAPEGAQSDTELILYILEVLANRKNTSNITGNTAQKAWESFQQNYMPEEPETFAKPKNRPFRIRGLVAAAAVVALLIFIPISTNALTLEEVWDIFARWAKETFSFVSGENTEISEPKPADQRDFSSLQEMLQESNRDASIVPTWIPDGFVIEKIEKDATPIEELYRVCYVNDDRQIEILIRSYMDADPRKIEINEDLLEIYTVTSVDYYIFTNNNRVHAMWIRDSYECYIAGDLSIQEIKEMIDSIKKG